METTRNVQIPLTLHKQAKALMALEGRTLKNLVRELLERYLAVHRGDLAKSRLRLPGKAGAENEGATR